MSYLVDEALIQGFVDGAFGLPIAHENRNYKPIAGTPYAELFIVHASPSVNTLGYQGKDLIPGFMQVNLNYEQGKGAGTAKQKADAIRQYFYAGRIFTQSGQDVFITNAGRGPARNVDSWFQVVVTINFEARVTRP